jgi:hypothetical protein
VPLCRGQPVRLWLLKTWRVWWCVQCWESLRCWGICCVIW